MDIPETNFRAYDIRGIYPEEIDELKMEHIGKALAKMFYDRQIKNVVVGRDNRENSEITTSGLIKGLLSSGINVNYTGITTHPAMHYFTFIGFDAAINVTASHNPSNYTGIKVDFEKAMPLYGDELKKVHDIIAREDYVKGKGVFNQHGLNTQYVDMLSHKFRIKNKIKVALDCGGGATSEIAPRTFNKIGAYVSPLFCDLSDKNVHEVPNPESFGFMQEVRKHTVDSYSNIGIGLDGDGDRLGVVDEKGHIYKIDQIALLLIKHIMPKHKNGQIIYDVKSTQLIEQTAKKYGGVPKIMQTGRSYVLKEMFAGNAVLGVELSGHVYIKDDYFGFDDAIYTACRLISILDKEEKPLSELMNEFPKLASTPEISVPCPDDQKFDVIKDLQRRALENKKFLDVNTMDGIRVKTSETGWFLIRAKNTTPLLSLVFEGKDMGEVQDNMQIVTNLLKDYKSVDLTNFS
ncbi:phosphomannomutase/phosphoglucomutase [candidate division WWE3 bacterium]|uniref:Phosphomannomutase/phosphoglucomutase n=1 Tax=candidate division WWE3 bacterium TaxID=2053526 RepID=A0A7X9DJL5_UNCKA|nr:phosphomannomutase/phosphoglucomutase [candidate division WWE3 bacterium]